MSILVNYTEDAFENDREDIKFGFNGDIAIPEFFEGTADKVEFAPYEDKVIKGQFPYRKGMHICPLINENAPGINPKKVVTDQLSAEYNSAYMAIIKFAAGTSFKVQGYDGFRVALVISGDYSENDRNFKPGQVLVKSPESTDDVVTLSSNEGCTLLVSRYKPVEGELPEDKILSFDFGNGVDFESINGNPEFTAWDGTDEGVTDGFRPYKSAQGAVEGVSCHALFNDPTEAGFEDNKGADLAFLKYEISEEMAKNDEKPAAKLHHHQGWETVLVMQGDYIENGASFAPGHLVVRAPGTHHEMTTCNGCVIFASRRMPVQGCLGRAKEMTDAKEAELLAAQAAAEK